MNFFIARTFQPALAKLDNQSQKAAMITAFKLQMNPAGDGKQFHRINKAKEKNFWSVRASQDIRLIVHKTGDALTLCYVDHHDPAYDWAMRRVFERHPKTGAMQIVELVETVREVTPKLAGQSDIFIPPTPEKFFPPLGNIHKDDLLAHGVPESWIERLKSASEDELLELSERLPEEACEAVLAFATGGRPPPPAPVMSDAAHPDESRRVRVIDNRDELEAALEYPWEQWTVFPHPSQREVIDADYEGPARVAGSAGTGKSVVALHRAYRHSQEDGARVLLSTFSTPLASALSRKLAILNGHENKLVSNVNVGSFVDSASELFELISGRRPLFVLSDAIRKQFSEIAPDENQTFLNSEWEHVIDAWQIGSLNDYLDVARMGRRSRVSRDRREILWPIFAEVLKWIKEKRRMTHAMLFANVADYYRERDTKPYTHILIDEAQDLGVPELRFLAAIDPNTTNSLFFAGDLGQRIFKLPFSWKTLGVDVSERTSVLTVNYRTTHQVRFSADKLLPSEVVDMDGIAEVRDDTISIFNGPTPDVETFDTQEAEIAHVAAWVQSHLDAGVPSHEIGLIVRSDAELARARQIAGLVNLQPQTLTEAMQVKTDALPIGRMHFAKGLEFRCVSVMACDDDILPLQSRIESASTEQDLDEVYTTEKHLLYVACTRARESLIVTGVDPASDYLSDMFA